MKIHETEPLITHSLKKRPPQNKENPQKRTKNLKTNTSEFPSEVLYAFPESYVTYNWHTLDSCKSFLNKPTC